MHGNKAALSKCPFWLPLFWRSVFWAAKTPNASGRDRSSKGKVGGCFFFGGSAWRVFFLAWKKKDDVDPLMKQVFEVLRDLLWVFFSHVYAVEGEKESDERVAEDV